MSCSRATNQITENETSDESEQDNSECNEADSEEDGDDDTATVEATPQTKNIHSKKILVIPEFLVLDQDYIDCPFLEACHYISSILLHYRFLEILTPPRIKEEVIRISDIQNFT